MSPAAYCVSSGRILLLFNNLISLLEKLATQLELIKQLSAKVQATADIVDKKNQETSNSHDMVSAILK